MLITQIEENLKLLVSNIKTGKCQYDTFIYELLLAYGHRKQSVTRLRSGERNLATGAGEVIWKRHLYFKQSNSAELHIEIDRMNNENAVIKHKLRFVIATNFKQFVAVDTKTGDTLDIKFSELPKHFDFFLPWANMEKAIYHGENPADVKAAEKMAKLFDLIKEDNFQKSNQSYTLELHNLNVFLTRLLFCFFAEDTEIFSNNQFSHAIESHTTSDGTDLADYLNQLFKVLNTAEEKRKSLPEYLASFPYVNGSLFTDNISSPTFSTKSRKMLIECGSELDWSDINPDIFGSMMQAVVHPNQRGGMGMHYTSVMNIMKVIEPLFLDDLYNELEKSETNQKKLQRLLQRIGAIKVFDPACGSGNFLIIAYKEIRKLEIEILKYQQEIEYEKSGQQIQAFSEIKLSQFHGIELDDFAHEVAVLSLWLVEHQMNVEFKNEFGKAPPSLPLRKSGNIVCENAAQMDWLSLCDNNNDEEVYIIGNPPYLGARQQSLSQKKDVQINLEYLKGSNNLDYISIWFEKASRYIHKKERSKFSFVSTNSMCQGTQVSIFWPHIFNLDLEIAFAHTSFKWVNNAKNNAGVICVIIGIRNIINKPKYIFDSGIQITASNINAYLSNAGNIFVHPISTPISNLPKINYGSFALDDGNFTLSSEEADELIKVNKKCKKYILPFIGAKELIQGYNRYCIWLENAEDFTNIKPIVQRVGKVKEWRLASKRAATVKLAGKPHLFAEIRQPNSSYLAFPTISSERRRYIPASFFSKDTIASNQIYIVPNASPWHFGVISSTMHMIWIRAVGGRLKTDLRYSSAICYNTFPFPNIKDQQIEELSHLSTSVLSIRELFPNKSLAHLYDPNKMPLDLLSAHLKLDKFVDSLYSRKPLNSDEERLDVLFSLYQKIMSVKYD